MAMSNVTGIDLDLSNITEESKSLVVDGRLIRVSVLPVLIVLGTIGNVLTILVMWRGAMVKSPIGLYMLVLAVADTGTLKYSISFLLFLGN